MTKEEAAAAVIQLAAKSLGYMDQGLGHGHYGWVPLSQDEFFKLHEALELLGAFDQKKTNGKGN